MNHITFALFLGLATFVSDTRGENRVVAAQVVTPGPVAEYPSESTLAEKRELFQSYLKNQQSEVLNSPRDFVEVNQRGALWWNYRTPEPVEAHAIRARVRVMHSMNLQTRGVFGHPLNIFWSVSEGMDLILLHATLIPTPEGIQAYFVCLEPIPPAKW
ncbi:MAG: hypothetical protein Q8P93_03040 [bacterium]|nr:hypothetical protein [bacterium]